MREILFRGKRISNGGWVYGGIVSSPHPNYDHPMVYAICSNMMDVFVDQESIGQYTGLTDKNGRKIFEGDIVRCWYARKRLDDYICVEQVVFNQGAFMAHSTEGTAKWWAHLPHNDGCKPLDNVFLREVEVIGTIHDNPELLEGGAS